jgi:hypothetical protein
MLVIITGFHSCVKKIYLVDQRIGDTRHYLIKSPKAAAVSLAPPEAHNTAAASRA